MREKARLERRIKELTDEIDSTPFHQGQAISTLMRELEETRELLHALEKRLQSR